MARLNRQKREALRFGKPERLVDKACECEWFPPSWLKVHADEVKKSWETMTNDLKARIASTTVIDAQNVGEYLYAVSDKEIWDFQEDFPSCVPPFRHFLIELKRPSRIFSQGEVKPLENGFPDSWGWQFEVDSREEFAEKMQDPKLMAQQIETMKDQYEKLCAIADHEAIYRALTAPDSKKACDQLGNIERTIIVIAHTLKRFEAGEGQKLFALPPSAAWFMRAELFMEANSMGYPGIVGPVGYYIFAMDHMGKILSPPSMAFLGGHLPEFAPMSQDIVNLTSAMLFPAMLTISFMNCKNVVLESHEPDQDINRERKKHNRHPFVRYHTINIEPMKKVLRTEGNVETTGLRRALHICRGHFATYTAERPLFGRVIGTFWKSAHARGSIDHGVVISDYRINAPKK